MTLEDLKRTVTGLSGWSHGDKIKVFGWWLHTHKGLPHFQPADVKRCYEVLHIPLPSAFGPFFGPLVDKKQLLKNSSGYRLEQRARDGFDAKYRDHPITVQVRKQLTELPDRVVNVEERSFLKEAIDCYRCGAFRAAITMTWNLAYDHLCHYILRHELATFNIAWPKRFSKEHAKCRISAIARREDFSELKESDVVEIARSAAIITADVYKVLDQKLGTRNSAAHPSNVVFTQIEAEEFISNIVNNVVLSLKL